MAQAGHTHAGHAGVRAVYGGHCDAAVDISDHTAQHIL